MTARRRRLYDPARHCGGKVDRNPESIRGRLERAEAGIAELEAIKAERLLTIIEQRRLAGKQTSAQFYRLRLKDIEVNGPDDRPCMQAHGSGTDHPGVGLCSRHCACRGRNGGHLSIYSRRLQDQKLQERIDELERSAEDILNLEPDVVLLRAKIQVFLNDRPDFEPETVRSLTLLMEQLRKTVDSINDKRFKASISFEVFNVIMHRMGEVVKRYVSDPETIEQIALDWQKISVDATPKRHRALAAAQQPVVQVVDNE